MQPSTVGRWGGRLTAHELPERDESLDLLSPAHRRELAEHWLERAASERRVADSFKVIRDTLKEAGADAALIALAARAVDDEYRHAEIARRVASRFAGEELPAPARLPFSAPEHRGASPELKRVLWVVGQCCLNETFASAVLEASLQVSKGALARAALRELLSDEIDHARIGWAFLAGRSAEERAQVAARMVSLTRANVAMWRDTPRAYPSDGELLAQGALSRELIESAVLAAVRDLVIPGFSQLGMPTRALERWLAAGASTSASPSSEGTQ